MNARAWLIAVAGTAVLIVALPYVLAALSLAPNGTETLMLVLLWVGSWSLGRHASARRGRQ